VPRIHRLPPELANQIAAGEVVERPASVVKELVENALDAGARRIAIEIERGGKRLIRVGDDGMGMEPEDARLALERHATSKIRHADDLAAIRTLGFRGEALPSIASVSRLVLRTRARGAAAGVELRVEGGVIVAEREIGTPEGTTVEVTDLFYNLPARRKFLKADAAESAQVSRLVAQLALGYPEVGFRLTSAGRPVLDCPPVADLRARFHQLYGDRPDLVEVRREAAGLRLSGFVAALGDQGPVRGPQNLFVNRRIVRDRTLAHAIGAAYAAATIKEKSPEAHLFIELAADRVDVNVHPTKAEVRFLEPSLVHEVLRRAVGDAIGAGRPPELPIRLDAPAAPASGPAPLARPLPGVLEAWAGTPGGPIDPDAAARRDSPGMPGGEAAWAAARLAGMTAIDAGGGPPAGGTREVGRVDREAAIDAVRPMVPLGQFRDTYIIAVDADGLCIVDQHVAHERVLFEQILEQLAAGPLASQRLLQPVVLDLSPAGRAALRAHGPDLERLGFEVEEFGGASVRIGAVPALLSVADAAAAVRALADDLEGLDRGARVDEALRRLAATMACHAAVRANQPLTREKMIYLLEELRRTAYSSVCPHGRPVVLRITRREIEKNFQRI
jgi:DNA mismatch repair protein MutL